MQIYDFRTIAFNAGTVAVAVTATVPDQYVGVIAYTKYVSDSPDATVTVKLMQQRAGTITGTLDVAVLTPTNPTTFTVPVMIGNIVAIVDPGHRVVAVTNGSNVTGILLFGYAPGRMRRP
jgi:uncharacterized membrane protein